MYRILSLFDCPLKDAKKLLPIISSQGFNALQISPLQPTKNDEAKEWWMLYQPISFEIGNKLGTKEDLYDLCMEAKRYGIIVIADTVVNHLANESDKNPLEPHPLADKELREDPDCWKIKTPVTNWEDRNQVTNNCMGLPGLNPKSKKVQKKVVKMLNEYADVGVDGFRFDAAKSIALPEEGCDFFPVITYCLNRPVTVIYGEVLFANQELLDKYAKYMKVLTTSDSTNRDSIIKFIENKDSYLSKDLGWTKDWSKERVTHEYMNLASYYPNTLYYARNYSDDWYEWQSKDVKEANKRLVKKYK